MRKPTGREAAIGGAALVAAAGLVLGARAMMKSRKAKSLGAKVKPVVKTQVAKAKKTVAKVASRAKSATR